MNAKSFGPNSRNTAILPSAKRSPVVPLAPTEEPVAGHLDSESSALDPFRKCPEVLELERAMNARIVGQAEAVSQIVNHYQTYLAGLNNPGRPICNLLMLGPTGCGKTRIVEALAESLAGDRQALIKIDCGEFQHSHEIAKLIGSPPGYLGHRETHPRLCQERLDLYHSEDMQISFVLFDEVEKASDALWNLLLGILDKGNLTLGDNRQVDFSNTMVFMTGNLGTAEAQRLRDLPWGFAAPRTNSAQPSAAGSHSSAAASVENNCPSFPMPFTPTSPARVTSDHALSGNACEHTNQSCNPAQSRNPAQSCKSSHTVIPGDASSSCTAASFSPAHHSGEGRNPAQTDPVLLQKMEKAVLEAAKRKFAPEFLNRLDRVILCHPLNRAEIAKVLDLEVAEIINRIQRHRHCRLTLSLSLQARDFLVQEGFDADCGARYLKRSLDKYFVQPLSSLLATGQISDGDELLVDAGSDEPSLSFRRGTRINSKLALQHLASQWTAMQTGSSR